MLSVRAPTEAAIAAYNGEAAALGAALDLGYPFGFFVIAEVDSSTPAAVLAPSHVTALNRAFRCHGRWLGLMLANNVSSSQQVSDSMAAASALRREGYWLLPMATAADTQVALAMGRDGMALSMPSTPPLVEGGAIAWAQAVAAVYNPMRLMLAASYVPVPAAAPGSQQWANQAFMPFVAAVDACVADSDSMLRFSAFAALAYGARGIFWRNAATCAPVGSRRFSLLSSINNRLAQWGNTFVDSWVPTNYPGGGYNVSRLWATGYELPGTHPPGVTADDLVQAADDDVLVAEMSSKGRAATRLLYVVDKRVSPNAGAAPLRTLRLTLRTDVQATQPIEGDCPASRCQCGLSNLGHVVEIRLPGGSGQLIALWP